MSNVGFAVDFLTKKKTTVRITREVSTLIDAYKVISYPGLDKEKIIENILLAHLKNFKKDLQKIRKLEPPL